MYYDTPTVGPYIDFLRKNRVLIIAITFALAILSFVFINPNLFSSDERIWLQDSLELERTKGQDLESKHVTKISLHVPSIDTESINTFKRLDKKLHEFKEVSYVSSLLSQKYFYNHKDSVDSQLLKVIETDALKNEELNGFIHSFSSIYKSYVNLEEDTFILYIFTKESFDYRNLKSEFNIDIEQISSADDKWEYLVFVLISALIIIILFRLIFKSFAGSITAVTIIGLTLLFSAGLVQLLMPNVAIHIAMSLIIVSISLLDYLYFYYRRSEEHTSELQSRETISYAVFCLKKKK